MLSCHTHWLLLGSGTGGRDSACLRPLGTPLKPLPWPAPFPGPVTRKSPPSLRPVRAPPCGRSSGRLQLSLCRLFPGHRELPLGTAGLMSLDRPPRLAGTTQPPAFISYPFLSACSWAPCARKVDGPATRRGQRAAQRHGSGASAGWWPFSEMLSLVTFHSSLPSSQDLRAPAFPFLLLRGKEEPFLTVCALEFCFAFPEMTKNGVVHKLEALGPNVN